mmetsp:Transcript_20317/g.34383  ORF Transcript_20317/g.34383 Transcript_20317/m.34383 type:complete len:332 (-) Transcript_20317:2783-3778(-)
MVMTPDTNTDTNTADADGPILSAEVEEFQSALVETVTELVIFSDDTLFEEKYGFTLTSYLKRKRALSKSLRKSAKQLKKVSKDTGITRIVGGGTGIFSGICVLGGIAAVPFSGGASLALAASGLGFGVASAGTTIASSIINETWVKSESKKITKLLDTLAGQDAVVVKTISGFDENFQRIEKLSKNSDVIEWMKLLADPKYDLKWAVTFGKSLDTGAGALKLAKDTRTLAWVIDIMNFTDPQYITVAENIAKGIGAPQSAIFGRSAYAAGTTTAQLVQGVFAGLGIAIGIWDIVDGAAAIKRSDHAKAYEKIACEVDIQIKQIEDMRDIAD